MRKYRIGLIVIGLIVAGLSIYVLSLGAKSKQDKKTFESAQKIAKSLNAYISREQEIPDSLQEAGINDVPQTITFNKTSNRAYRFCATYNTDKGYGGFDLTSTLTGAALSGLSDGMSLEDYESSYTPSSLYISYSYHEGQNCQNVSPNLRSSSSSSDVFCGTAELRQRYASFCDEEDASEEDYSDYLGPPLQQE